MAYRSYPKNIYLDLVTGKYGSATETGMVDKVRKSDPERFIYIAAAHTYNSMKVTYYQSIIKHELSFYKVNFNGEGWIFTISERLQKLRDEYNAKVVAATLTGKPIPTGYDR